MLSMYHQITIKTLAAQGKTPGQIARIVGCHRNTVRQILRREVQESQTRNRPSQLAPYHQVITNLLDSKLSMFRIWQTITTDYQIPVAYSTLVKYVRKHLSATPKAFVVQDTLPAQEAEVDFGYAGVVGGCRVWILVVTLAYSRLAYYQALPNQSIDCFLQGLSSAFDYFTGVPQAIKVDNLKAAVVTNNRFDLEFNRTFLEFSRHYRFVIKPCTPRTPNQKGKVESGVKYVKGNFLPGRSFTDLSHINQQLGVWMNTTANVRRHGTTKLVPRQVFDEVERVALTPLPSQAFSYAPPLKRRVGRNCHVHFDTAYYSVPAIYVGQLVEARVQGGLVIISQGHQVLATHAKAVHPGVYVTLAEHYPQGRIYTQTAYQARYEQKMKAVGVHAHEWFLAVVSKNPLWSSVIKKVLGYVEVYGPASVNLACRRACVYQAITPGVIGRILEQGLYTQEIEPRLLDQVARTVKPTVVLPTHTPVSHVPLLPLVIEDDRLDPATTHRLARPLTYYQADQV